MPDHHHHHHHDHAPTGRYDRAFAVGTALNLGFVAAGVGFGLAANSMALLADAAHNLGDVLGLLLGWGAAWLARRPPTPQRTYGWGRGSIFAVLINATVLLIAIGGIAVEAVHRMITPQPVSELIVILVAAAGIVINGATALMFMRGRGDDLNIRAQFIHMAGDAGVSAGVVVAGLLIRLTGWFWLDPLSSLGIAVVILIGTWGLLREAIDLAMDAVPPGVPQHAVEAYLVALPGVQEVHDLHIWGLSTTETALTAHLVCTDDGTRQGLHDLSTELHDRFGIGHSTLQIETNAEAELCRLRPQHIV